MATPEQAENQERIIRGRAVQITSLLENFLVRAILVIKSNIGEDDIVPFDDMGLSSKIIMVKNLVKQHYPANIYTSVKKAIKKYQKASLFRNQMAHCVISWPDETYKSFLVWDTKVADDGMHVIEPITYTIEQAKEEIEKIKASCREVINSIKPITEEFDRKFPEFWMPV